ncbi:MAG: hypothetical protein D9V45_14535 [Chloroflexi bacterium]|nr:hypothetical protein [Anaerolinea sp.]TDA63363.1 MAG: hypothetical protein D9V45_14535 [Chloroflexota bacterium]
MRIDRWCHHKITTADPASRNTVVWILLVLVIFLVANAMSEPLPSAARDLPVLAPTETHAPTRSLITPSPAATETVVPTPTRTPIPAYLLENTDATDGIIIGTVLLVVIVLVGTLAGINVRRKQHLN